MKCAHHDDDEADDGDDPLRMLQSCRYPPTSHPLLLVPTSCCKCCHRCRCQRDCQAVVLSYLPPPPVPCCQHVLLFRRLFALKILFIAIARICTKIFYNAGQQHRDGCRKGWGGEGRGCQKGDKADNEIVVTQFGNDGQKKKICTRIWEMTNDCGAMSCKTEWEEQSRVNNLGLLKLMKVVN